RGLFQKLGVDPKARNNNIAFIVDKRRQKFIERFGDNRAGRLQFRAGRKGEVNGYTSRLALRRFITEGWKIPVSQQADVTLNHGASRFCNAINMPEQRKSGCRRFLSAGRTGYNQKRSEPQ